MRKIPLYRLILYAGFAVSSATAMRDLLQTRELSSVFSTFAMLIIIVFDLVYPRYFAQAPPLFQALLTGIVSAVSVYLIMYSLPSLRAVRSVTLGMIAGVLAYFFALKQAKRRSPPLKE